MEERWQRGFRKVRPPL